MSNILVKDHVTPNVSATEYHAMRVDLLSAWYGHLVVRCGYCGNPYMRGYVCDCGYQVQYNDDMQRVWSNK